MYIYKITNKINNKCYIGQTTKSIQQRWHQHLRERSTCRALKAAIEKYGKNNFNVDILLQCPDLDILNGAEKYFISIYKSFGPEGYNLTSGGEGHIVSEETKQRQSSSMLGKLKGFVHSEQSRKNMSEARKGKEPWNKGLKGVQTAWNKGKTPARKSVIKALETKLARGVIKNAPKLIKELA